ncbi:MAG: hypothetical protein KC766_05665 [Myxococcales bacterium]|nr:hypothetical protein [Myxococcales bacterium]
MLVGTVECAAESGAEPAEGSRPGAFPSVPRPLQPERQSPPGWAARLIAHDPEISGREIARRVVVGLGLSSLYGVALGARVGAQSLFQHAAGVPLGLILVALVGAPSVFVFLSMCRAAIDGRAIAASVARSVASAGLLLAGLAPAAALFVVSSETAGAAAGAVTVGLWLGGGVALARMLADVLRQGFAGKAESALGALAVAGGFALFAIALATRVWGALLPILGGA